MFDRVTLHLVDQFLQARTSDHVIAFGTKIAAFDRKRQASLPLARGRNALLHSSLRPAPGQVIQIGFAPAQFGSNRLPVSPCDASQ